MYCHWLPWSRFPSSHFAKPVQVHSKQSVRVDRRSLCWQDRHKPPEKDRIQSAPITATRKEKKKISNSTQQVGKLVWKVEVVFHLAFYLVLVCGIVSLSSSDVFIDLVGSHPKDFENSSLAEFQFKSIVAGWN